MWSSMNSMLAMMMSPLAISSLHRCSAAASCSQSAAACRLILRPGMDRSRDRRARSHVAARWLSIVTITTRTEPGSTAEVGLCFIQGLEGYGLDAAFCGVAFRVAPCLTPHEERDFSKFLFRFRRPSAGLIRD